MTRFQLSGIGKGYDDLLGGVVSTHGGGTVTLPVVGGSGTTVGEVIASMSGDQRPSYPQPDVTQMLPFKPKAYPRTGSHPVAGGEFPPPPAASALLKLIPPPQYFHGPFVDVDKFLEHFLEFEIPEGLIY